jgi:hypothetical protein
VVANGQARAGRRDAVALLSGLRDNRAIDLRTVDRHPLASVGTLVLGLRCSRCPDTAPMPKLLGPFKP